MIISDKEYGIVNQGIDIFQKGDIYIRGEIFSVQNK